MNNKRDTARTGNGKKALGGVALKDNKKTNPHSSYQDSYYRCYSVKLNEFLKSNNLRTIKEIRHPKTNKIAFVYEKNQQLDDLLTVWTKNRSNI